MHTREINTGGRVFLFKNLAALLFTSLLASSCAAWPLLTGAAGLATGKPGQSTPFWMLSSLVNGGSVTLDRVEVSASSTSLAKTTSLQLQATAIYSNSTHENVTSQASWSSSDSSVVSVAPDGTATGLKVGSSNLRVEYKGKSAETVLMVTPAPLTGLTVSCVNQGMALPVYVQRSCGVTGHFADSTTQDLTADPLTVWQTGNSNVATVNASGIVTGVTAGNTSILAKHSGKQGSLSLTVTGATIQSIEITPPDAVLPVGKTQQFQATGIFSDSSHQTLTGQVTWNSDNPAVGLFSSVAGAEGLLSAESAGRANLTASWRSVTGTARVTVFSHMLKTIEITPANPSIANGTFTSLIATGHFDDGSTSNITTQVTWSSDDATIVSLSNGSGLEGRATANNQGTTTVRAAIGGIEGSTTLTVTAAVLQSIQVVITDSSIARGTSTTAHATGFYSDGSSANISDQVSWSATGTGTIQVGTVSATSVDLISPKAGAIGNATITASMSGINGSASLVITAAKLVSIQVTPINPAIALGETKSFTATGTYTDNTTQDLTLLVTWNSVNATIASISNASGSQGVATGLGEGSSAITAAYNPGTGLITSPSSTLTVGPKILTGIAITSTSGLYSMARGTSLNLQATGHYSDGSTGDITSQVSWSSDDIAIVSVSNVSPDQGQATGTGTGSTNVRANFSGVEGTVSLTVTPAVLVSIQVSFADGSIARGTGTTAQATGTYTDGSHQNLSDQVSWSSAAPTRVQIGTLTAVPSINLISPKNGTIGSASITAILGPISGSSNLVVTGAALISIQVDPTNPAIALGLTRAFTATGTYTDDTTQDLTLLVTWASSNLAVAGISNAVGTQGIATSLSQGSTNITATLGAITSPPDLLTVGAKQLTGITIGPAPALSIAKGRTQQFNAQGHYTDGSSGDLTTQVTWNSDDASCAAISNADGSRGLLTALSTASYLLCNSTGITASLDPDGAGPGAPVVSASTSVDVTAAELVSINVSTSGGDTLPRGLTKQYTATGVYSDGSTLDLTSSVTWSSTNGAVASVNNGPNNGLVTGLATGTTVITAQDVSSVSGTANLQVTAPVLVSISVGPTNPSIYTGAIQNTQQFTATGRYSDYPATADQDVTTSAYWDSTSSATATISNAAGSKGLATSVAAGSVTVSATLSGVSGSTSLTVLGADTTAPTVDNVTSLAIRTVRVTFSEPMNIGEATAPAAYKVALTSAVTGLCSAKTNFASSPSALAVTSVAQVSSTTFDLSLGADQVSGTDYTVLVNRDGVHDLGQPATNALGCSNTGSFSGQEQLKVTQAEGTDTTHVILSFSKPVLAGNNAVGTAGCTGSTECSYRYKIVGPKDLGNITGVKILDGTACGSATRPADSSKVCITHSSVQTGAFFTVIAANGVTGDGFDNAWGSIRDSYNLENVQTQPRDRATFQGQGTAPVSVDDGPLVDNPFGDNSDFGNLTDYNQKVYIGPNTLGNNATRFDYDGKNPMGISFTFTQDTNGTGTTTRNTGSGSRVTIGHKNCTLNSVALSTGCGPDNEDGRGVFVTGTLGTTPYIFIAGAKDPVHQGTSQPDFSYAYYSSDAGNTLNFKYVDFGGITGAVDAGASSLLVQNNRLYLGSAKRNYNANTPDLGFVSFNSADTGMDSPSYCTPGSNCDANDDQLSYTNPGVRGRRIFINALPNFGGASYFVFGNNASPNYGYNTGVDSMFAFNGYIYAANGGYHQTGHNGSVIRSKTTNPIAKCTGPGVCPDWMEIGPLSNAAWHGASSNRFSLDLAPLFDMIPADRAVSMFESYNERLYMTRTVCVTANGSLSDFNAPVPTSDPAYTGCLDGTYANRRPQLWKCDPTNGGADTGATSRLTCESNEWSLVGDNGTGFTNFGSSGNHSITMVKKNGNRLYVAFDNEGGLQLWRTKLNVTNPGSLSSDWEQVGSNGLNNDILHVQQFFSAVSVQPVAGGAYFLYLSVGLHGVPVKVYRQQND